MKKMENIDTSIFSIHQVDDGGSDDDDNVMKNEKNSIICKS